VAKTLASGIDLDKDHYYYYNEHNQPFSTDWAIMLNWILDKNEFHRHTRPLPHHGSHSLFQYPEATSSPYLVPLPKEKGAIKLVLHAVNDAAVVHSL
jgi:hypothetical protein